MVCAEVKEMEETVNREAEKSSLQAIGAKLHQQGSCLACRHVLGVGSFLLYSVHEGIRGIPLDPNDKSDALVPVSGTSLAVGIDFHAGEWWPLGIGQHAQ